MTVNTATLISTAPPWLLRTCIELPILEIELNRLCTKHGFITCLLDGNKMTNLSDVVGEFAKILRFPDYFGHNINAFKDCLLDLSWIEFKGICITVAKANDLLTNQPHEVEWLVQFLNRICQEWSLAVEEGEAWDRPAIPFHVLFHVDNDFKECLSSEVATLPSLIEL